MLRKRNSSQVKEQDKAMVRDLREKDISNMPNGEFKATIMRLLTGLKKRMEDIREALTAEIKDLKKNHSEMKNAITEIGHRCDAMNTRLEEAEE